MKRVLALLVACSFGCAAPIVSTVPADLEHVGKLGHRTAFELDVQDPGGGAPPAPTPEGPAAPEDDASTPPAPEPGAAPDNDADTTVVGLEPPKTEAEKEARQPDAPLQDPGEPDKRQRARKGLFWAGIVLTAIGGAGTIGFAAAGEGFENKLNDGYESGRLTHERDDQLRTRGELMNALAATSAAVTLLGVTFATIAYGIDYTRCGTLAKRRKPCKDKDRKK